MASIPKQTKIIKLDLSQIKGRAEKAIVKKEIGDFIINEILLSVSNGKSPVAGFNKPFKKLNSKYAKEHKGNNRTANLELEGDMLDALISKNKAGDKIEIGIFAKKQQGKADGHNNLSGESNLPTRRFIPDENENFKRFINNGINQIISDAIIQKEDDDEEELDAQEEFRKQAESKMGVEAQKLDKKVGFDLKEILGEELFNDLNLG